VQPRQGLASNPAKGGKLVFFLGKRNEF